MCKQSGWHFWQFETKFVFKGRVGYAYAEEDEIDNDEPAEGTTEEASVSDDGPKVEDDDTGDVKLSASPDVETTILFTKPAGTSSLGTQFLFVYVCYLLNFT